MHSPVSSQHEAAAVQSQDLSAKGMDGMVITRRPAPEKIANQATWAAIEDSHAGRVDRSESVDALFASLDSPDVAPKAREKTFPFPASVVCPPGVNMDTLVVSQLPKDMGSMIFLEPDEVDALLDMLDPPMD